jgi:hypothetical protein
VHGCHPLAAAPGSGSAELPKPLLLNFTSSQQNCMRARGESHQKYSDGRGRESGGYDRARGAALAAQTGVVEAAAAAAAAKAAEAVEGVEAAQATTRTPTVTATRHGATRRAPGLAAPPSSRAASTWARCPTACPSLTWRRPSSRTAW